MTARARLDADRTAEPLGAPVLVHFPSDRVGLTWCGLPFDPSEGGTFADYSTDKRGLRFSTDMRLVTCPACDTETPVYPHDLAPSEVALAKVLAAVETWLQTPPTDDEAQAVLMSVQHEARAYLFTVKGTALLDRARKAGVL